MPENPTTQPPPANPAKPSPDYDTWTVERITAWAPTLTDEQREAAIAYEAANKNRPEVLKALGATPAPPKEN